MTHRTREGFLWGLLAYGWWGLMPLYLRQIKAVAPLEILAQRIVWSLVVMALIVTWLGRWRELGNSLRLHFQALTLTSALIAVNWFFYLLCVDSDRIKEASLGYFITPLVNVLLGLVVFHERLRRLQWLALGLATLGVFAQAWLLRDFPWLGLGLALSFSFYGLIRKQLPIDGVIGLSAEAVLLAPIALGYLVFLGADGQLAFFSHQGSAASFLDADKPWMLTGPLWLLDVLILATGIATVIPLVAFGQAARLLPLSTVGFLQYLAPSIQFLIAVFLFGEMFVQEEWLSFAFIWAALVVFSVDSWRRLRVRQGADASSP